MNTSARRPELDSDSKAANVVAFMRSRSDNKLSVFELARVVFSTLFECDKRLAKNVERLETRLAALEQRKSMTIRGVWHADGFTRKPTQSRIVEVYGCAPAPPAVGPVATGAGL